MRKFRAMKVEFGPAWVSLDFFVVPTAKFRVLFVLLILAHNRRCTLHFNVTSSPSAEWTAQQVVKAFPDDRIPRYLLRDRDCIYGKCFRHRVKNLGIEEILTAARSPWQIPYVALPLIAGRRRPRVETCARTRKGPRC
jgi:hypothetical protein